MPLAAGRLVGPYEIVGPLGAGGMGEVYRAFDARLNRAVAIKVILPAAAHDQESLLRFGREARVLASLNHPNIAQLHGLEDVDGCPALVIELVEGVTLAERIARGALPLDEALHIAQQIAAALAAAHERGIVHRDLKPANVKALADGAVKVLDFGLAKALDDSGPAPSGLSDPGLPTVVLASQPGVILGTTAYMSPEQARGLPVDRRADLWSFGVVLWEMLTGQHPFSGGTQSDTLAAILKTDPNWRQLPGDTPVEIERLLRRCLTRTPAQRLDSAVAARLEIEEAIARPASGGTAPTTRRTRRAMMVGGAAATSALLAALATYALLNRRLTLPAVAADAPVVRLTVLPPEGWRFFRGAAPAVSPDGEFLVYPAEDTRGGSALWMTSLRDGHLRRLEGTEGARYPFWSPDAEAVAFFAPDGLRRIDVNTGAVRPLAATRQGQGGTWSDGTIVFAQSGVGLLRIAASGGEPVAVTRVGERAGDLAHRAPAFLPDGRHLLYFVQSRLLDRSGVYVADIGGTMPPRRVVDSPTSAAYDSAGVLLYVRASAPKAASGPMAGAFLMSGTLVAHRFDTVRLELVGDPVAVAEAVQNDSDLVTGLSSSANGVLAYRLPDRPPVSQMRWFDRAGRQTGEIGGAGDTDFPQPAISPDGSRVAYNRNDLRTGIPGIWVADVSAGTAQRLTLESSFDICPVWSPDGGRIVFTSTRSGAADLYVVSAAGGQAQQLARSERAMYPTSWSFDGKTILFQHLRPGSWDLGALDVDSGTHRDLQGFVAQARLSRDGKWLAYSARESGTHTEIRIQRFPPSGRVWAVSVAGRQPQWRADGRELFFIAEDFGALLSMPVDTRGDTPILGKPQPLFRTVVWPGSPTPRNHFAVTPDGQRFLVDTMIAPPSPGPISVVVNWRRLLPPE